MDNSSNIISGFKVNEVARHLADYSSIYVVYDRNVSGFADAVAVSCGAAGKFQIEATEERKVIGTVLEIDGWLLDENADRTSLLLAIGGGITSDIAGFAASIYRRGIRFAFVPTTLLAQVDAAIGGKNGVNFEAFKNMLGVIRQPEFTYLCPEVLGTLPYRDFLSGAAEMLKTFIIDNSEDNYAKAVSALVSIRGNVDKSSMPAKLHSLIMAAASVKAGVVARDPYEKGERRKLNLGHTFAHAIEWLERSSSEIAEPLTHGEAVAVGIVQAAILSEKTGMAEGLSDRLAEDFKNCGLPTELPCDIGDLSSAIFKDKKAEGKMIHFILIRDIGHVEDCLLSPDEAIKLLSE